MHRMHITIIWGPDGVAGMVMGYRLDNKRFMVQFPAWTRDFPLH